MTGTSDLLLLARVAGSLLAVLLVALLAARLARRAARGRGGAAVGVRERIGLTRDTSAVVVQVGDRLLLLGVSPHHVTLLTELGADPRAATAQAFPAAPAIRTAQVLRVPGPSAGAIPAPRAHAQVACGSPSVPPLTRRELREASGRRAAPPSPRGPGSVLDPRTWQQGLEALRDLTARRG
ncbi:MAG TPA: flagellar biosynthetic protein FliO [Kineosporiaceae bacterium]